MTENAFIPVISIPGGSSSGGKAELRRVFRNTVRQALHDEKCAQAIAPYKCNGEVLGHKVLDNSAAIDALIRAAPDGLKVVLKTDGLNQFEKTRCLDDVLRAEWQLDKRGKADGTPSKRALLRQQKQEE